MSRCLELPYEGLYDSSGSLFHHRSPVHLKEAHYLRLEENGLNVRSGARFTVCEKGLIIKNWLRYAKEHNLPIGDSFKYLSIKTGRGDTETAVHRRLNLLWPELCRGMPHRTALQVRSKAIQVLDPNFLESLDCDDDQKLIAALKKRCNIGENKKIKAVSDETMILIKKGIMEGKTLQSIITETGTSSILVHRVHSVRRKWLVMTKSEKFESLWKACLESGLCEKKFRQALDQDDDNKFEKVRKNIKWSDVSNSIMTKEKEVKSVWEELVVVFRSEFGVSSEKGCGNDESFELIRSKYINKPKLTPEQTVSALEIFCSIMESGYNKLELVDKTEFARLLVEEGISNFKTYKFSEVDHLLDALWKYVIRFNKRLFPGLRTDFEWKVKFHVVLWAMKRIHVWQSIPPTSDLTQSEVILNFEKQNRFMTKWTKKFLRNEHAKKWLEDADCFDMPFDKKFDIFTMEAFVLFSNRWFKDDFVFPTSFHNEIKSDSVIEILPQEDDDTEMVDVEEAVNTIEKNVKKRDLKKNTIPRKSVPLIQIEEKIAKKRKSEELEVEEKKKKKKRKDSNK